MCVELRAETDGGVVGISEQDLHRDGPDAAFLENVALLQSEMIDAILRVAGPGDVHLGHAAMANPHGCPRLQRLSGNLLECMDQIAPFGVGISVLFQIKAQAIAKFFFAEDESELLDDAGRFGINDGAVGGFGVFEVFDILVDGSGAFGGVDAIGSGLDGEIEALPNIFIGLERSERLIGHVLREAFLEPEIIEPAHGSEIAEPLMGELVEEKDVAVEMVAVSGGGAEKDGFFAEERGASVLHAAVSEAGDEDEIVFGKRKGLSKKFREIVDALRGDLLDFGSFRFGFLELRLTDVEAGKAGSLMNFAEGAGSEGEKIGADGASFRKTREALAWSACGGL